MNVDGSAAVVGLRDGGELQASIENLDRFLRHCEQSGVDGQSGRGRLAMMAGFCLEHGELVGELAQRTGAGMRLHRERYPREGGRFGFAMPFNLSIQVPQMLMLTI